ncbi:MAG: 6-carboxytetrahydropterin synthase [Fimbriimonadaceae bacterium]
MPTVRLTRKVSFSSGHRFWNAAKTEPENRAMYGEWASRYNHGHNYVLEVTASGKVDETTGMVVNIKDIDDALQERIVSKFAQRSINDEVPGFDTKTPCLENLLLSLREEAGNLPGGARLEHIKLEETPLFYGEWTRDGDKVTVTRSYEFAASHRLQQDAISHEENLRLYGKCNNPAGHGHNFVLEVTVGGKPDPATGFITDLGALDAAVKERVLDRYDHKHLNTDVPELLGKVPTSEVVALEIYRALDGHVPGVLERVSLRETDRSGFEVRRGDL